MRNLLSKFSVIAVLAASICIIVPASSAAPPIRACGDGIDNDSDDLIDFPSDPGCENSKDRDEFNAVTPPPPTQVDPTSSINEGDTVAQGQVWTVTTVPDADLVEFWADGSQIGTDTSEPYTVTISLSLGAHRVGLVTNINGVRTIHTGSAGQSGTWANITVTGDEPPPPPPSGHYFLDEFATFNTAVWIPAPSTAVQEGLLQIKPNGEGGTALAVITTPNQSGPNPSSKLTSAFQGFNDPDIHTARGEETWYRVRMRFPTGYVPVDGSWNWLVEWHNDGNMSSTGCVSTALGMQASGGVGRLWWRPAGGNCASPTYGSFLHSQTVQLNHWYDLVFRIKWATQADGSGSFSVWIDGQSLASQSFPTLFHKSDGTHDHPAFGLYNYHPTQPFDAEIQYDRVVIGPTAVSVGFSP